MFSEKGLNGMGGVRREEPQVSREKKDIPSGVSIV